MHAHCYMYIIYDVATDLC